MWTPRAFLVTVRRRSALSGPALPRPPAAVLDRGEELGHVLVEERGLLDVHRVAGHGRDPEARVRHVALHEEPGLEARLVLITHDDEGRYLDRLHLTVLVS